MATEPEETGLRALADKIAPILLPARQNATVPAEDGQHEAASMRCLRKKMSQVFSLTHRYKRTLQAMAAGTFLIYMTLVLYQNVYGYNGGDTVQVRSSWCIYGGYCPVSWIFDISHKTSAKFRNNAKNDLIWPRISAISRPLAVG